MQLERRDPHDPCPYLLAVWTPGIIDKPIDLISSFGEHTVPGTLLVRITNNPRLSYFHMLKLTGDKLTCTTIHEIDTMSHCSERNFPT